MSYKYFIKKEKINNNTIYIPYIYNKNKWSYLIFSEKIHTYFVSKNNFMNGFTTPKSALKFIAKHRMSKNINIHDRPTCLFFNPYISMIPLIGIIYFLFHYLKSNRINITYLFNKYELWLFIFIQLLTIYINIFYLLK
jgi:hypothetical protein